MPSRTIKDFQGLVEMYEWILFNGFTVSRLDPLDPKSTWVCYDESDEPICDGRDMEEACWGAWDKGH